MSITNLLLLSLLLSLFPPSTLSSPSPATAYEVLRSHGLPIGLLPKGIQSFDLDADGRFQVRIDRPCTAKFETEVHYDRVISGTISYGEIASLSGVSAQELFLWFPVHQIRVDVPSSGLIYFDVGVIYKQFSLSLFDTPPECRPVESSDPDREDGGGSAVL